jgi:hypothetical protein
MFARWKLRGMYATCMWLVQLLLVLSKQDPLFSYIPEFYVETLVCVLSQLLSIWDASLSWQMVHSSQMHFYWSDSVQSWRCLICKNRLMGGLELMSRVLSLLQVDSFHALRRSDPPFVSPSSLLQQGLSPLVIHYIFLIFSVILVSLRGGMNSILINSLCLFCAQVIFLVTHFSDVRIVNSDIRDIILQSISVLVQYKEHVVAFERSQAACEGMVGSLLASFDNRFWIPVSNILLRLCKGSGFGASKCSSHGESFSPHFQRLLKEKCIVDEKLFASFLNRLFNTLNWTITEFSVAIKEMQENVDRHQVQDLQQRKCTIMFELSCNLERILEFFTQELPQAFLQGPEMNLIRLCELIIFVLNHTTCSADALFFDRLYSYPHLSLPLSQKKKENRRVLASVCS